MITAADIEQRSSEDITDSIARMQVRAERLGVTLPPPPPESHARFHILELQWTAIANLLRLLDLNRDIEESPDYRFLLCTESQSLIWDTLSSLIDLYQRHYSQGMSGERG